MAHLANLVHGRLGPYTPLLLMLSDRRKPIIKSRAKTGQTKTSLHLLSEVELPPPGEVFRLVHLESIGELQPRNRQRRTRTIVGHDLPREEMANPGLDD